MRSDEDDEIFTSMENLDKDQVVDRWDLSKKFESVPLGPRHVKQISQLVKTDAKAVVEENTVRLKERVGNNELAVAALEKKMELKDQGHEHQIQMLEQRLNEKISSIKLVGGVLGFIMTAIGLVVGLVKGS